MHPCNSLKESGGDLDQSPIDVCREFRQCAQSRPRSTARGSAHGVVVLNWAQSQGKEQAIMRSIRRLSVLFAIAMLLGMFGCKATPASDSGFIDDSDQMTKHSDIPFDRAYWNK